jgi:hypothetical protein
MSVKLMRFIVLVVADLAISGIDLLVNMTPLSVDAPPVVGLPIRIVVGGLVTISTSHWLTN